MTSQQLISVTTAKEILQANEPAPKIRSCALHEAIGHVLAGDLHAPIDIPAFHQSSMDGYAFAFEHWQPHTALHVAIKVPAGRADILTLQAGEAARVFTGSPLPQGADTVVMQEMVEVAEGKIHIVQPGIQKGDHYRARGSEITKGDLALPAGSVLTASAIGFLAGLGYQQVPVYDAPVVAIVITGDELQQPGEPLQHGQVYEASSFMLRALLREMGIPAPRVYYTRDSLEATTATLQKALEQADIVLLTGGVSVGEFDFVVRATQQCGIQQLFHRVKQRPGKPLFAGIKEQQLVFGLPGNPSSVLTCFYQYVWPLLRRCMGHTLPLTALQVPLTNAYAKSNHLTQFLKGMYHNGAVTILTAQESYRMKSFAVSNCFVELEEAPRDYQAGDRVNISLLPQYG